jgi:hypothetical protein
VEGDDGETRDENGCVASPGEQSLEHTTDSDSGVGNAGTDAPRADD